MIMAAGYDGIIRNQICSRIRSISLPAFARMSFPWRTSLPIGQTHVMSLPIGQTYFMSLPIGQTHYIDAVMRL